METLPGRLFFLVGLILFAVYRRVRKRAVLFLIYVIACFFVGEESVIFLPMADEKESIIVAELKRTVLEAANVASPPGDFFSLIVSIGMEVLSPETPPVMILSPGGSSPDLRKPYRNDVPPLFVISNRNDFCHGFRYLKSFFI